MTRYFLRFVLSAFLAVTLFTEAQTQTKDSGKPDSAKSATNPFDEWTQFSATLNGGIGRDHDRRIYRSGKLMRADFGDHYRLTEVDTRAIWIIYPPAAADTSKTDTATKTGAAGGKSKASQAGRCNKWFMADASTFPFVGLKGFKVERTSTDKKETVDGHPCKIEEVTFTSSGDSGVIEKMQLWEAEDLNGFPVKIEAENMNNGQKYTLTYTNVSVEPPDPKLFAIPKSCSPVKASKMKQPGEKAASPAKPPAKTPPQ